MRVINISDRIFVFNIKIIKSLKLFKSNVSSNAIWVAFSTKMLVLYISPVLLLRILLIY